MKASPAHWPPLIERRRAPLSIRVRDIILTIIAWLLLLYLIRDVLYYLLHPYFMFTGTIVPEWKEIWLHLKSFIYLAIFLVLWIIVWGIVRRRDLRRIKDAKQPAPLSLAELAKRRGMDPERLSQLRQEKVVVINFDTEHRITSVSAVPPRASATAPPENPA
jgi:poly-beta-1,6-N-acetyl-D-glucosamine biosynthesis protein PgaD